MDRLHSSSQRSRLQSTRSTPTLVGVGPGAALRHKADRSSWSARLLCLITFVPIGDQPWAGFDLIVPPEHSTESAGRSLRGPKINLKRTLSNVAHRPYSWDKTSSSPKASPETNGRGSSMAHDLSALCSRSTDQPMPGYVVVSSASVLGVVSGALLGRPPEVELLARPLRPLSVT